VHYSNKKAGIMLKKIILTVTISLICSIGYADTNSSANQVIIVDNSRSAVPSQATPSAIVSGVLSQNLKSGAPVNYTVKKNDTVTRLALMYLTKISLWPQFMGVKSLAATKIYSGDQLHILSLDGRKVLLVDHVAGTSGYVYEKLEPEVRDLPLSELPVISTARLRNLFLHPTLIAAKEYESLPKIIGGNNPGQLYFTTGDIVYTKGYIGQVGDRVSIYSKYRQVIDPDSKENLGNEVRYNGDGLVTQVGPVSTISLTNVVNQITDLDRVDTLHDEPIPEIVPHPSDQIITGKIVALYDAITSTAEDNSVVINRGSRDGVELGQVYDITDTRKIVDPDSNQDKPRYLILPPQTIGELLIYKVYDKISFGLITDSSEPINLYSVVQSQ
jgi:LysM repeat protein